MLYCLPFNRIQRPSTEVFTMQRQSSLRVRTLPAAPVWRGEEIEGNSSRVLRGNLEFDEQSCADGQCQWPVSVDRIFRWSKTRKRRRSDH